jgi:hypothetical protein
MSLAALFAADVEKQHAAKAREPRSEPLPQQRDQKESQNAADTDRFAFGDPASRSDATVCYSDDEDAQDVLLVEQGNGGAPTVHTEASGSGCEHRIATACA